MRVVLGGFLLVIVLIGGFSYGLTLTLCEDTAPDW